MFVTLRAGKDASYRVESARISKHPRLPACRTCVGLKVKCSRDLDGCRRCLNKGATCVYAPFTAKLLRSIKSTRPVQDAGQTINSQHSAFDIDIGAVDEGTTGSVFTSLITDSHAAASNVPKEGTFNVPNPSFPKQSSNLVDAGDHVNLDSDNYLALRTDAAAQWDTTYQSSPISSFGDLQTSIETRADSWISPSESPSMSSRQGRSTCHCQKEILSMLEATSAALVHATHQAIPSMLKHTKCSLAQCQRLLTCVTCNISPEFLMLFLVLCQKLAAAYDCMINILAVQDTKAGLITTASIGVSLKNYEPEVEEEPCIFGGVIQWQLKVLLRLLETVKGVMGTEERIAHQVVLLEAEATANSVLWRCSSHCAAFAAANIG